MILKRRILIVLFALISIGQSNAGILSYSINTTDAPIWDRLYSTGDGTSESCSISNTFGIGVLYLVNKLRHPSFLISKVSGTSIFNQY